MNADQIWETTMDPETRTLIKFRINDVSLAERKFPLMNNPVEKEWINANVEFTMEDDFAY